MAFFAAAPRQQYTQSYAPARPQIEIDLKDALARMDTAIYNDDIATYKQIVEHEFPETLAPRMKVDYKRILKYHYVPLENTNGTLKGLNPLQIELRGLSPLQLAVLSGNPRMVEEVLKLGNDLEHFMNDYDDGKWQFKTARGIADILLSRHADTPEMAARYKEIKSILLQHGARPKTVTTITGTRLVFPENKANVNVYKRSIKKGRKSRKTRNTRNIKKTRRV